jgi:hypothetical protein
MTDDRSLASSLPERNNGPSPFQPQSTRRTSASAAGSLCATVSRDPRLHDFDASLQSTGPPFKGDGRGALATKQGDNAKPTYLVALGVSP